MEEPLEQYEDTTQKDRMISLLAWVITAFVLFYLAVFTFESFLRQVTPEKTDTQSFVMDSDSSQGIVIEEPVKAVAAVQEDHRVSPPAKAEEKTFTTASVAETRIPVKNVLPVEVVPVANEGLGKNTGYSFSSNQITEKVQVVSVPEKPVLIDRPVFQMKMALLEKEFSDRYEVFDFLKSLNLSGMTLEVELVRVSGKFRVIFGRLLSESELDAFVRKIQLANSNLTFSYWTQAQKDSHAEVQVALSSDLPAGSAKNSSFTPDLSIDTESFDRRASFLSYTIQVGSFLSEENAKALRDQLIKKGYTSKFESPSDSVKPVYKVLLGNFATREEARKEATKISEKEELPVYVRSVHN